MDKEIEKKTFLHGAVVLGIAGLVIKVMGMVFRIPLANIIGADGMGYYQTAYPVYVLLLTLATAGVPVAISRMVAERNAVNDYYEAYRVFRISFFLLLLIGTFSSVFLFFGSESIVAFQNPEDLTHSAKYAMMAIAPALIVVPIQAAFRGFFQGLQNMRPTAISQIVEQLFRVIIGLILAILLVGKGVEFSAAGASFGATAGGIAGLTSIVVIYVLNRDELNRKIARDAKKAKESGQKILLQILWIAIPITIGAAVMPIMNAIDALMVPRRLIEAGFTGETSRVLYGQLTGFAGPMINFPQVLTQAIAMSLVPAVAAAYRIKDMVFLRHNVQLGLRMAWMIGMPCAVGFMSLSKPIMLMLYPMQKADAIGAAPCFFILSFGVIFLASLQTLTGVLQGVGKQMIPVRNIFIGAFAKVALTYALTGIPSINIRGAAIGTVAAYVLASLLNIAAVMKYTGTRFNLGQILLKPFISVIIMAGCVILSYNLVFERVGLGNTSSTLISIAVGAIVYGIMLMVTRAVSGEELILLPKGERLATAFKRFERRR
ncbi:MAG: putative polysaccharide biosynthesis protein [Anaerovoracaceae bacterium]|jgi:stage V sporulation protein B